MFDEARPEGIARGNWALAASFIAHCLGIGVLIWGARPVFVRPSSILGGEGGVSKSIVYFAQYGAEEPPGAKRPITRKRIILPPKVTISAQAATTAPEIASNTTADSAVASTPAGARFGSLTEGPVSGHEVRPALPYVFPDPAISNSQLPTGVQGDVIVEITIDAQGRVVDMRVLAGLGFGVEQTVIAALQNWRFHPATEDGVAIASKQDVYFHFPR